MTRDLKAEALLIRVAEHDKAALGELYNRYAPGLLGFILRILPDRSGVEEVVEGVFIRLWAVAKRFSSEGGSVAAWLLMTARADAVYRRRAGRKLPRVTRAKPDPLEKTLAWLPRPAAISTIDRRRELLNKVVVQLPKAQRGVLELALFEGLTEIEIAKKLNEPLGKVQSGLRAGMRFLRHRLRAVMGTWFVEI